MDRCRNGEVHAPVNHFVYASLVLLFLSFCGVRLSPHTTGIAEVAAARNVECFFEVGPRFFFCLHYEKHLSPWPESALAGAFFAVYHLEGAGSLNLHFSMCMCSIDLYKITCKHLYITYST